MVNSPRLCYNISAETNEDRGVLLLNAVLQRNNFIVGKAPSMCGLASRHSSQQRRQAHEGRFVMTRPTPLKDYALKDEMFSQGLLWCSRCRRFLPIKDFPSTTSRDKKLNYGYRIYCILCSRPVHKVRRAAIKTKFIEHAGGKCQRCGYNEFISALDFHHIYAAQKEHNVAHIMYLSDFEKVWREIDKCCLLCRNCHSGYEAIVWRAEFIRRGDGLLGWTVGAPLPLDDRRYETTKPPRVEQSPLPLFSQRENGKQFGPFEGFGTM